jgi:poly(A) polymerase
MTGVGIDHRDMYRRTLPGPVVSGDLWDGREIIGFAFAATGAGMVESAVDVLLLAGDQAVAKPPTRSVPLDSNDGRVSIGGKLPPHRLAVDEVVAANEKYAYIAEEFLDWPQANPEMANAASGLCQAFDRLGHVIWLTGGAARDVVAGWGVDSINDLDITGTAPVGAFLREATDWLVAAGLGDRQVKMNTPSMVCSASRVGDQVRLFEYKPLMLAGCNFLASDGDLKMDSEKRDLTFNCLFYDPLRELLLDPTGRGISDLCDSPIKFVVASVSAKRDEQAGLILRVLKFMVRYATLDCDTTAAEGWVRSLPSDLARGLDDSTIKGLSRNREKWLGSLDPNAQFDLARSLGPAAENLLRRLDSVK